MGGDQYVQELAQQGFPPVLCAPEPAPEAGDAGPQPGRERVAEREAEGALAIPLGNREPPGRNQLGDCSLERIHAASGEVGERRTGKAEDLRVKAIDQKIPGHLPRGDPGGMEPLVATLEEMASEYWERTAEERTRKAPSMREVRKLEPQRVFEWALRGSDARAHSASKLKEYGVR